MKSRPIIPTGAILALVAWFYLTHPPEDQWEVEDVDYQREFGTSARFFPAQRRGESLYGFYDGIKGRFVIEPSFDEARGFLSSLAPAKVRGKWGFIKLDGTWTIQPKFEDVSIFVKNRGGVKIEGKWGFVDSSGELVIPAIYESASPCGNGLHRIEIGGKDGFVADSGNVVIEDYPSRGFCLSDDSAEKALREFKSRK